LKEKGNKAFALEDYELAFKLYTEGLEQLRDMPALYTNRAQALIKLKKFKEAISDCEWALKCNDKCIKAYIHMGRAHLGLKHFTESRRCYEKILDLAPERETLVKAVLCRLLKSRTAGICVSLSSDYGQRFRIRSRESFTKVFAPPFEHLLENVTASSQGLLPCLISVIGAMSVDEVVINKLASREEFWKSSFSAMRAVGLLSVVLPKSAAATQEVVQQGVVKKLLKILKVEGQTSSRYSIKAMAVCTASGQQACEELVKLDKRLVTMRKLLGSSDELVVGNAALCLGHCLAVKGTATGLLGTDCVIVLLRHAAGKSKRVDVQQNAAITLGKLCRVEPRLDVWGQNAYFHNWDMEMQGHPASLCSKQDNAPCHKAEMVQEWFDDHNNQFEVLTPPPNSPDLNPIQLLWDVLDKQVRSMQAPPYNLQDLKDLLLSSWCQIPQHTFRGLVESIPQRVRAVSAAKMGTNTILGRWS
ncbi:hypothetical protein QTP86_000776, partial [Hemibagrus guttatus]